MIRTNVAGAPIVVMSALWLKARSEFLSLCLEVRVSQPRNRFLDMSKLALL
jgi:hypothetical protein